MYINAYNHSQSLFPNLNPQNSPLSLPLSPAKWCIVGVY